MAIYARVFVRVCVRVCVCVCARVRACVRACVRVRANMYIEKVEKETNTITTSSCHYNDCFYFVHV